MFLGAEGLGLGVTGVLLDTCKRFNVTAFGFLGAGGRALGGTGNRGLGAEGPALGGQGPC